jgi:hypothetical protein
MNIQNQIALQKFAEQYDAGVEINAKTLLKQIGTMNFLAISGGRFMTYNSTVFLPVAKGYYVAVTLTAADDYTVSRIFVRAGKVTVKHVSEYVFAENVGEIAYQVSCFENAA